MEFRTKYNREIRYSNPGERFKIEYGAKLDKYGNRIIEPRGKIDFKAFINSHAKSVDLNLLLAKFVAGDTTALTQRAAQFIDITGIPDNISDFLNIKTQAEKLFDTLPVKIKDAFGNNVNNFLSNYGTKEWYEVMSKSEDQIKREMVQQAKAEVKANVANIKPNPVVTETYSNPGLVDDGGTGLAEEVRRKLNES